jgi:DNA-binding CsgD family transcriptional regulator
LASALAENISSAQDYLALSFEQTSGIAGEQCGMKNDAFFHIVEELDQEFDRSGPKTFLARICDQYGLSHACYLGIDIPTLTDTKIYGAVTYSDAWVSRYLSQNYFNIDPVVTVGMRCVLPLDWSTVRERDEQTKLFFGEAGDFGVGAQGLSFPIRGAHGETALFSINSHLPEHKWAQLKRVFMRDFSAVAYHFHTRVLQGEGVTFPEVSLSRREKECLKWAAAGKTTWETGKILGISGSTVDFFLEKVRVKLKAVNKVQAVATAIRLQLI